MDTRLDPRGSRVPGCVVIEIIDGRPWNASRIRNNNLRQHCRMLGRTFRPANSILEPIRSHCRRLFDVVATRGGIFESVHPSEFAIVPVLVRIAWYWQWWHRSPEDWTPDPALAPREQWRSLLHHLFSRGYPLPEFFDSAWLANGPLTMLERNWYCHVAAGLSLRQAEHLPKSMTARALHLAMQAPAHFAIWQALRWAQVKSLGGSDALVEAVLASRMARDFCSDGIWLRLIEKVAHDPAFPLEDFGAIVDLFWVELANDKRSQVTRLVSTPLSELRRRASRFWYGLLDQLQREGVRFRNPDVKRSGVRRQLAQMVGDRWSPMGKSQRIESFGLRKWRWQIHQLDTHLQLIAEGRIMKHCVASYRRRCLDGWSAIFSFRMVDENGGPEERLFTVEVDPRTRRIVQIRNRWNRWLSIDAVPVVREWARRNDMLLGWR